MKRIIVALSVALAAGAVLAAQEVKSTTTIKSDDGKAVMYTGCLQSGAAGTSYILEDAIPVKQETRTETQVNESGVPQSATKTTTTTYALVPNGGSVEFQSNVGHKVEVTALLIPAGDDTTEIKSKTETEVGGKQKEVETKEKIEQSDYPQLRVVSIKHLADRCTSLP